VNLVDVNGKFRFLYPVVYLNFPCVLFSIIPPDLGELAWIEVGSVRAAFLFLC
jgi:hypothetical protein